MRIDLALRLPTEKLDRQIVLPAVPYLNVATVRLLTFGWEMVMDKVNRLQ
jgi:hypothetical protein